MNKLNAIILAGTSGKKSKRIYEKNKAFLKINNQPIVLNVLGALQNSEYINQNKIAIIGPKKDLEKIITIDNIYINPEKKSFIKNCINTYDYLSKNKEKTLFITCDLPFITSNTINNFIKKCNNYPNKKFYFQVINIKNIPKEIEPFKKTKKFHLKGRGYYRTANMILFEGSKIKDRKQFENQIRSIFEARRVTSKKALLKLIWALGKFIPQGIKYFSPAGLTRTRGLTEKEIENSIEKKLHIPSKIIETADWRAAADIDYPEDFEFFNRSYEKILNGYSKNIF